MTQALVELPDGFSRKSPNGTNGNGTMKTLLQIVAFIASWLVGVMLAYSAMNARMAVLGQIQVEVQ